MTNESHHAGRHWRRRLQRHKKKTKTTNAGGTDGGDAGDTQRRAPPGVASAAAMKEGAARALALVQALRADPGLPTRYPKIRKHKELLQCLII